MNARNRFTALAGLLMLTLLVPGTVFAADKAATKDSKGNVSDRWVVWPKADHAKEFEAAVKEYVVWLKKAGDPFKWVAYQPIAGADLSYYVFRSDDHQWKDFDAEEAWHEKSNDDAEFQKLVGPHIAKASHFYAERDAAHTHFDGKPGDYRYFRAITRQLKPGSGAEVRAAIDKIHTALQSQKWPYPYILEWQTGGRDNLRVILPMKSFADMVDPTPSLPEVLVKALGADDAAATMKQFGSAAEIVDDTVGVVRPDLGTQK